MTRTDGPQKQALLAFIAKEKFLADGSYFGALNERDRAHYTSVINTLAIRLTGIADKPEPKIQLLEEFKATYPALEDADTEERERAIGYLEELMDIFGVTSSDGLLNNLMYGFNPSASADARNQEAVAAMTAVEREFAKKLAALTATSALEFLTRTLGNPLVHQANTDVWFQDNDPNNMVTLTNTASKPSLIWMVKGRFLYSKLL